MNYSEYPEISAAEFPRNYETGGDYLRMATSFFLARIYFERK